MAPPLMFWVDAVLSLGFLLLAAKAHGRQVRLERELAGYWTVVFGGHNPEWVEALWRRDRRRFWALTIALGLVAVLMAAVTPFNAAPVPRFGGVDGRPVAFAVLATLLWAPALALAVNGVLSFRRWGRAAATNAAGVSQAEERDPGWHRRATRGSWAYWSVVSFSALIIGALAWL
jgi:hypothetical protein